MNTTQVHCQHRTEGVCTTSNGSQKRSCIEQAQAHAERILGSDARVLYAGESATAYPNAAALAAGARESYDAQRASNPYLARLAR